MSYQIRAPQNINEWRDYYALRWQILRAPHDQPPGSEQDELENGASHLAAFDEANSIVAVGRLHQTTQPGVGQIRYMAVTTDHQRQGIGMQLLQQLEQIALRHQMTTIILNARESVVPFYQRADYLIQGEGPLMFGQIRHRVMQKQLS